jgi:hypothetical protein
LAVQESRKNFTLNRLTKNLLYWFAIALLVLGAVWQFINIGGNTAKGIIGKILSIYVILPILVLLIAWKLEWLNKKFFLIVLFTAFIFGANYIFHGLIITEKNLPLLLVLFALILLLALGKVRKSELYGQNNGYYGSSNKGNSNKNKRRKQSTIKDSNINTNENI